MPARIKIVWPSGSGYRARIQRFYVYSAIFHIVFAVTLALAPRLFGGSRPNFNDEFLDVMQARLVGDLADEPAQPAVQPFVEAKPEPVKPKPEPPPEDNVAGGDVVHSKRAEPTPPKEDPKPAPPSDPEPLEDSGDTANDGGSAERVGDSSGGVQAAGEISLFGWYQSSVSRALYSTWRRPMLAGLRDSRQVVINFEIQKNGTVTGLRVTESSDIPALDRSALRAVADASPLPRLPPAWRGSSMTAAYVFEITAENF